MNFWWPEISQISWRLKVVFELFDKLCYGGQHGISFDIAFGIMENSELDGKTNIQKLKGRIIFTRKI